MIVYRIYGPAIEDAWHPHDDCGGVWIRYAATRAEVDKIKVLCNERRDDHRYGSFSVQLVEFPRPSKKSMLDALNGRLTPVVLKTLETF